MHEPRPLGGNERAFWKLSEASPLNYAVAAHVSPRLEAEAFVGPLARLQARHPLLRAAIELRGARPWFVWAREVRPIPIASVETSREAWAADIERELKVVIPWRQAPLARLVLLQHELGTSIVLICHHAIGDGLASLAAVRDLLWDAVTGEPRSTQVFARSIASESALPSRSRGLLGGLRRVGTLAGLVVDGARLKDPLKCPVDRPAAPHERVFHLEPRAFSVEVTTALAARARQEGSTVQGAVGAAMLLGVARRAHLAGERTVTLGSPINVRERLEPKMGDAMGMYLAVSHYRGTLSPSTRLWSLARAIRARIQDDLDSGRAVDALPLIDLFYDSLGGDKVSAEEFGRKWAESNGTTGLTNVGRLELEPPPGVRIERVEALGFPSGLDVFNAVASAYAGSLILNFNWPEPCFTRAGAMALCDDVVGLVKAAVMGDPALTDERRLEAAE